MYPKKTLKNIGKHKNPCIFIFDATTNNTYPSSVAGAALDLFQARWVVIPSVVVRIYIYTHRF